MYWPAATHHYWTFPGGPVQPQHYVCSLVRVCKPLTPKRPKPVGPGKVPDVPKVPNVTTPLPATTEARGDRGGGSGDTAGRGDSD